MLTAEQLIAAQKANLAAATDLSKTVMAGFERVVELNMAASKAAFSESFTGLETLLAVKTPQDLAAVSASMGQPVYEKSAAYSRHLVDIATSTSAEFTKAVEGQTADAQAKFASLVDNAAKNAPAGSEAAVAILKSSVSAANNALESVQKAVKQATEVAEANFNSVAATATGAATKATAKKR